MRNIAVLSVCLFAALSTWAATTPRVPPYGIKIDSTDRADLTAETALLGQEIEALRSALANQPSLVKLLPDLQIFHKAVDWPLRYGEFYRSNEVAIARRLLKEGRERAQQLRTGKAPWLTATGLVVRGYLSKLDGSVQPYGLVVPAHLEKSGSPRRLEVWLHGRDNHLTELKFIADRQRSRGEFAPDNAIVLHPYGRFCNAFKFGGEVDVFEALEHVRTSYRISDEPVVLRGFSMGGAGVWHLAAHHPQVWTVAAPGAGFAETAEYTGALSKQMKPPAWEQSLWQLYDATDYAANFFNLPVVAYNGDQDKQRQAADVMERAMRAEGLALPRVWGTNVGHKYTAQAKKEIDQFIERVLAAPRKQFPERVRFTTRTLRFNEAPGVELLGLTEHWQRADFDFDRRDGRIRTRNVSAFALDWPPDEKTRSVEVDGQRVALDANPESGRERIPFRREEKGGWKVVNPRRENASVLAKAPGLQGPIDDAFMDSFLFVRPTGKAQNPSVAQWIAERLARATNEWRAQFRGDVRIKDDVAVTAEDMRQHHLVLWGDPQSNRLLARLAANLPIRWTAKTVRLRDRSFESEHHVPVFVYPNLLAREHRRYVVVNSGFTFAAAGPQSNALQTPKLPDYALFDIRNGDAVVAAGFFDEQWQLKMGQ